MKIENCFFGGRGPISMDTESGATPAPDQRAQFEAYMADKYGLGSPDGGILGTLHCRASMESAFLAGHAAASRLTDLEREYLEACLAVDAAWEDGNVPDDSASLLRRRRRARQALRLHRPPKPVDHLAEAARLLRLDWQGDVEASKRLIMKHIEQAIAARGAE